MEEQVIESQTVPQVMQGPDQSYKKYIGIKLIDAYPCEKFIAGASHDGYNVKYSDGYESWSPKDAFESAYLKLEDGSKIQSNDFRSMLASVTTSKIDDKTTLVKAELTTGFVQYETSSCVDPKNYDENIGRDISIKVMENKLWFALGFILQWAKYGLKKVPKSSGIPSPISTIGAEIGGAK